MMLGPGLGNTVCHSIATVLVTDRSPERDRVFAGSGSMPPVAVSNLHVRPATRRQTCPHTCAVLCHVSMAACRAVVGILPTAAAALSDGRAGWERQCPAAWSWPHTRSTTQRTNATQRPPLRMHARSAHGAFRSPLHLHRMHAHALGVAHMRGQN